jgi:7-cyano-7-deazaguanine synthase
MKTIVLLSGGLDSATVLAGCVASGDKCLAIGYDYDQPHRIELDRAQDIAHHYQVPFKVIGLPAMLSAKVDDVVFAGRNLVLASFAIAFAQAREFDRIAVGCNATDWDRFPDCRPAFWKGVKQCARASGVLVSTPLLYLTKREVVEVARQNEVPIDLTWSCYSPQDSQPCGKCLACKTREEALQ